MIAETRKLMVYLLKFSIFKAQEPKLSKKHETADKRQSAIFNSTF